MYVSCGEQARDVSWAGRRAGRLVIAKLHRFLATSSLTRAQWVERAAFSAIFSRAIVSVENTAILLFLSPSHPLPPHTSNYFHIRFAFVIVLIRLCLTHYQHLVVCYFQLAF